MDPVTKERLFGFRHAFDSPVTLWITLSVLGALVIDCTTFGIADHWYAFFVAIPPLIIVLLAIVAIFPDQPHGYTQRVGLGAISFLLFGHCLGHLGYIANDADFRPIVMLIILTVELNDVFAYITGKTFGHRKIVPHTSPNKKLGGALGALFLTTALV